MYFIMWRRHTISEKKVRPRIFNRSPSKQHLKVQSVRQRKHNSSLWRRYFPGGNEERLGRPQRGQAVLQPRNSQMRVKRVIAVLFSSMEILVIRGSHCTTVQALHYGKGCTGTWNRLVQSLGQSWGITLIGRRMGLIRCDRGREGLARVAAEWLASLLHILEVPGSNLGPEPNYPDWEFSLFSCVLPGKFWDSNFNWLLPLPYPFQLIIHQPYHLTPYRPSYWQRR
jgi:hypothetical protein